MCGVNLFFSVHHGDSHDSWDMLTFRLLSVFINGGIKSMLFQSEVLFTKCSPYCSLKDLGVGGGGATLRIAF